MNDQPSPITLTQRLALAALRGHVAVIYFVAAAVLLLLTLGNNHPWERMAVPLVALAATLFAVPAVFRVPSDLNTGRFPGYGSFLNALAITASTSFTFPALLFIGGRIAFQFRQPASLGWLLACAALVLFKLLRAIPLLFGPLNAVSFRQHLRGTKVLTPDEAYSRACELRKEGEPTIFWGGLDLPESMSEGHFCIVGGTGSGKTISLRLLMQSVLPRIHRGSATRAVIYDAKQDAFPILSGMRLNAPIVTLNPFDARCVAWDIAEDVQSPAEAFNVASILIEEEAGRNNQFFTKASRGLLGNVLKAFTLTAPKRWTLADVVYVLKSKDRIKELLTSHPFTTETYREYFQRRETTAGDIELTIKANIEMLEPVAALWAHASNKMSLRQFFREECVLLLPRDEDFRASLDAFNRVIFYRLVQLAIKQPDTRRAETWFFLDEFRQAGKLEGINSLIVEGRSHGVRVVIGFQDLDGLREVYGERAANELAGVCVNKAFLKLSSESTARWAAQTIGEAELHEYTTSETKGKETSTTKSESIPKRDAVLPSELMGLPSPNKADGYFHGYYLTSGIGAYTGRVHFAPLLAPEADEKDAPRFIQRDPLLQYLPERTQTDDGRLGLSLSQNRQPVHVPKVSNATVERISLEDLSQEPDPD